MIIIVIMIIIEMLAPSLQTCFTHRFETELALFRAGTGSFIIRILGPNGPDHSTGHPGQAEPRRFKMGTALSTTPRREIALIRSAFHVTVFKFGRLVAP